MIEVPHLRAGHVDQVSEVCPGCYLLTGWSTDQDQGSCLEIVHKSGIFKVLLGTPRVCRPDVCKSLGLPCEWAERLGFFLTVMVPDGVVVQSLRLAGQVLDWKPEKCDQKSSFLLIQHWLQALNWGHTSYKELEGFLQGALGTALRWIDQPIQSLELAGDCHRGDTGRDLILQLPACSDLAWLQIWRLVQEPLASRPAGISLIIDGRISALGDPEQIAAELLRIWPLLGLPEPTITISAGMASHSLNPVSQELSFWVDGRRWLLPINPWWEASFRIQPTPGPMPTSEVLLTLGFEPIQWSALSVCEGLADQWAWQLQVDQWLERR